MKLQGAAFKTLKNKSSSSITNKQLRGGLNCPAALPISRDGGT